MKGKRRSKIKNEVHSFAIFVFINFAIKTGESTDNSAVTEKVEDIALEEE